MTVTVDWTKAAPMQISPLLSGGIYPALTLASYGDSRALGGAAYASRTSNLMTCWLEALSLGRIQIPGTLGLGQSGYTSAQLADATLLASSIATARAGGASGVILIASTNDRNGTITAAQSIASLQVIEEAWKLAGIFVIWLAEYPRGASDWSGTDNPPSNPALSTERLAQHMDVRRWIMGRRGPGVFVVDTFGVLSDRTAYDNSLAGWARQGLTTDGIHLGTNGSYLVAKKVLETIDFLLPPGIPALAVNSADEWNATTGTGTSILNATLNGSTGTVSNGTGSAATGWICGANALSGTIAAAYSKEIVDSREWQQVVYSGTGPAGASTHRTLQQDRTFGTYGIAQGARYRLMCEYEIDAGQTGVYMINPLLQQTAGGTVWNAMDSATSYGLYPTEAYRGVFVTDPYTLDQTTGSLRGAINIGFTAGATVSLTLRVGNFVALPVT